MLSDLAKESPAALILIQRIRDKRGIAAARDAVYVAIAALWNASLVPGTAYYDFFTNELPAYLRGVDNAA
jgi:hypothetical protein